MIDLTDIQTDGSAYFVTSVTYQRKRWFAWEPFARIVIDQIAHYARVHDYHPLAYCVMPDHYHLVILLQGSSTLSQILHGIHSYSTTLIAKEQGLTQKPKIWQGRAWDKPLRSRKALGAAIAYTLLDPWRSGLVENPVDTFDHSNLKELLARYGENYVLQLFQRYEDTKK